MESIIGGSILVSLLHGLFPNHWLPVVVVSKTESWPLPKALGLTLWLGILHVTSTLILGFLIYYAGKELFAEHDSDLKYFAGVAFLAFGIIYAFLPNRGMNPKQDNRPKVLIGYLSLLMILSPCLEVLPFFFAVAAEGFWGFVTVSAIYAFFSLLGIVAMAYLGMRLFKSFENNFLQKHEKKIVALIFVLLGVFTIFVE